MTELIPRLLAAFLPVLIFLGVLIYLDSYKLVRLRWVILTMVLGGAGAAASYAVNAVLLSRLAMDFTMYSRYISPFVEESAKALVVIWFIRSQRTGFLVDASILGFAVGTGFALLENAYYLRSISDAHLVVWVIRGLGTAVMHGGTTAIFAITSQLLAELKSAKRLSIFLPGLLAAVVLHSLFNHLFFSPIFSTLATLLAFPLLIFVVFEKSEQSLRNWLEVGFDADTELLELMNSGRLAESRVGKYLQSLKEKFTGEVVVDLLCYLRIHLELSMCAKGILMMREAGFEAEPDEETRALFQEMKYLEKSIGKTGRLALFPFLHVRGKELWQLYMIGK
ncbi:MAG TPA: PrsW family glutamic-type intramembrane protease [Candidatus Acidoferrum sp.]|nr:PrsW family glutamic-type intramembrane protease [Candidatus Acidoferrum sp.]